jgi:hypothetical protein
MAEDQTAYSYQAPDQRIYDMLFGTGAGGFGLFPQVQQYYQSQFENLGAKDSNPFTYSGERIAGFSPREEYAMQLADAGIGSYAPFLARAQGLTEEALATQAGGISEAKAAALRAQQQGEDYTRTGIGATQAAERGLRGDLGAAQRAAERSASVQNPFIREALAQTRASTEEFDPSSISRFSDPYEDAVVQQTIADIQKGQAQGDIARFASEVGQGSFGGARSRLGQQESTDAATRAMMKEVGGIRSAGYQSARDAAMNEFGRSRAAQAGAAGLTSGLGAQSGAAQTGLSSLLSGLGAQRYGAGMGTAGALTGAGSQLYGFGSGTAGQLQGLTGQLSGAQTGAAGAMQGLAGVEQGFRQGDIGSMMNVGAMNRARNQALMDLNYQNFVGQYNMPQQLASGFANFLTGAGPLAGGFGYSGATQQNPYGATTGYSTFGMQDGGATGGDPIPEAALEGLLRIKEGPRGADITPAPTSPFQVLKLFGVEQETIDDLVMSAGDMPKGLVDLIIKYGQQARDAGIMEEPEKKEDGGRTLPNKGLAALAKKAPEVVRKMGFQVPQKRQMGGIVNARFPMASRKLGA